MPIYTKALAVGTRVNCSLPYAGRGIIFEVSGEQAPGTVRSLLGGVGVTGGNARLAVVFANGSISRGLPEALLRASVQWTIHDDEGLADADEISAAVARAQAVAADRATVAQRKAEAFAAEVERLKSCPELSHLSQGDDPYSGTLAAKNMRAMLRRAFPGVKFSVRKAYYGSVSVQWTDGPLEREVESVVMRFKGGHFDGMEDTYRHEKTPWLAVFGGADYVNTRREFSSTLVARVIDELFSAQPGNFAGMEKPTAAAYEAGGLCAVHVPGIGPMQQIIREAAHRTPA